MPSIIKDGDYVMSDFDNFPILFNDAGMADEFLRDQGYREEGVADDFRICEAEVQYAPGISVFDDQIYLEVE